ncbi:MarR family transcriptional regulator [Methylobacillus gramineus]|uniref:MarR family winged helix-turn-helix transcriptional regulator n=1 Tax=Methylobacillus gramineus TaxID=755169 RepID=UPI001CFF87F3|nr:MarR family transcriptional regulator [Methylobacillus gramineus]MCB5184953.1 MarR family transcriptional regulator [Methylobacillus gramineus]
MSQSPDNDHIDLLINSWNQLLPGKDFSHMELATRLLRTVTLLTKEIMPVIVNAGLNQGEFDVLATLYRNGGRLSPTTLYQRLLITSGAMTNRLATLTEKGLVQRAENPEDKRSIDVILSTEGRLLFEPLLDSYLQQLQRSLNSLEPSQQHVINQGLRPLLLALDARSEA